jgi:Gas vesicle synthesis protein GvpL/GvpF
VADSARYAYAVTRGLDPAALAGDQGLRGAPLEVVSAAGLDAVVGDVPLEEFSEDALKRNLESLSWLEEVARAHDEVVRRVTDLGPSAPLRLATIFHDDDAVRRRLGEWHDAIVDVLDRVDGRAEWSVKVIAPPAEAAPEDAAEPATGAEFLRRRKARSDEREQWTTQVAQVADQVHASLSGVSVATRVLPAQDPQLTGLTGTMALNGAYLVDHGRREQFEREVAAVRARFPDLTVETGGPWPPYSFAVLDQP